MPTVNIVSAVNIDLESLLEYSVLFIMPEHERATGPKEAAQ
jgi:hypothetical protein